MRLSSFAIGLFILVDILQKQVGARRESRCYSGALRPRLHLRSC